MHEDDSTDMDSPEEDIVADSEATVRCPYCGETVEIAIDPDGGEAQEYVEDCEICCRPWQVSVHYDVEGRAEVSVSPLDE